MTALTMLLKLSSVRMISDASLATSVPAMPWKSADTEQSEENQAALHNYGNSILADYTLQPGVLLLNILYSTTQRNEGNLTQWPLQPLDKTAL